MSGSFSVKAYFNLLEGVSPHKVPAKCYGTNIFLLKLGFFAWELWWGKVLTST